MRDDNARIREKFELSLDGRQIASIVVGALVIVGVVFVLGLNVGRQISARRAEAAHPGDLEALDRAPPPAPVDGAALTFHDRLTKQRSAPPAAPLAAPGAAPQPPAPAAPAPAAEPAPIVAELSPPAAQPSADAPAAAPAQTPALAAPTPAVAARTSVAAAEPAPRAAEPPRKASARAEPPRRGAAGAFTVQLGAAQSRAEAERLAARFRGYHPRVEAAAVAGKGHWYRVRAGSFETRDAAERLRRDIARGTGASGFVVAER